MNNDLFGLNENEVLERKNSGKVNVCKINVEKSYFRIIFDNIFTLFNFLLLMIALTFVIFIIVLNNNGYGEIANKYFGVTKFLFLIPVVMNITIGTIQEIHGKIVLNRLKLVTTAKQTVIRSGKEELIPYTEIVIDDIISIKAGDQASCDILVIDGEVSVDESFLTGESDLVKKGVGDTIYSGSAIVIGASKCKAVGVGDDTYTNKLSLKVKTLARHESELMRDIKKIISKLSIVLLIVSAVVVATLCYKISKWGNTPGELGPDSTTMSLSDPLTWSRIILTLGAFAIGVIPSGLVLTTSVTLAVSIVKLSKENTLIQELYSLENLSRVDTICLDKTGTLTDETMNIVEEKAFIDKESLYKYIKDLTKSQDSINATLQAFIDKYGVSENIEIKEKIPFSSKRKSSGIIYLNGDELLLGAPEYLLSKDDNNLLYVEENAKNGKRVLALTLNQKLIGLFVIEDQIRKSAKDTIEFFYDNNVDVKIISGDNPLTVSNIAKKCGVKNAFKYISLENIELEKIKDLVDEYTIFARVSPEQKQAIIEALQEKKHKVAMTGDGVNDILALRKANASITFAKATAAAKSCSDVVLLDNDFSHLKEVVGQGRRVVNNMERSSVLFLMKSFAVMFLAFVLIFTRRGQLWYQIENVYMLESAVIGTGGFLLSLEMSKKPIKGRYLQNVLFKGLIAGFLVGFSAIFPVMLYRLSFMINGNPIITQEQVSSMISLLTVSSGIVVALIMCMPLNKFRVIILLFVVGTAAILAFMIPKSYILGMPTTIRDFKPESGGFMNSNFMHEFMQPWNNEGVVELFTSPAFYISFLVFDLVAIPIYIILFKIVNKHLKKYSE